MNSQQPTGMVVISYPGPPQYTGGTIQYNGNQTVHTFSNSGTLKTCVKWKSWYAWYPVRVKGKWYWRTQVFRRRKGTLFKRYDTWIYGDDFDVLKDQ